MNISEHLKDPEGLERLYRIDKHSFRRQFEQLYPDHAGDPAMEVWRARLQYASSADIHWGSQRELLLMIAGGLIAGFIAKLPQYFGINEEFFYQRNLGFIVFPVLIAYFLWRNQADVRKWGIAGALSLAGLLFINLLWAKPGSSDTLVLSCIHLPLFLWSVLGYAYGSRQDNRALYLRYNGDLIVMTTLILIAGAIMSGVTIGLFELIGFSIAEVYMENVGVYGAAAAPIVATYLVQKNPQLVGRVSPVIARIFSPLVLIMVSFFLLAMLQSKKDPYNDREFLLMFNGLLIGVIAIVFFAVGELSRSQASVFGKVVLFLLSVVTIIVNVIALSAILFRLQGGITPNRLAVLGGNLLFLITLVMIAFSLFKASFRNGHVEDVDAVVSKFLPILAGWTIVVTFLFPLIFGFK
jgi:hypothetical protein